MPTFNRIGWPQVSPWKKRAVAEGSSRTQAGRVSTIRFLASPPIQPFGTDRYHQVSPLTGNRSGGWNNLLTFYENSVPVQQPGQCDFDPC
jgi:hypothetical protein